MNKTNILSKLIFLVKKQIIIVVVGEEKERLKEEIKKVLSINLKNEKDFLIITADNKDISDFKFFLKYSKKPIFVLNKISSLKKNVEKTISSLPRDASLILNNDNFIDERIKKLTNVNILSYGFSKENDLIGINNDISLKVDYKGNVVPVWFKGRLHKNIYPILSALAVGLVLGLNLVEMSQMFKEDSINQKAPSSNG